MHVLYIDSIGGLAGDMFLAAALDAGFVSLPEMQELVSRWLPERVTLRSEEVVRNEMRARTFRVEVAESEAHHHGHPHGEATHAHGPHRHPHHRNLHDVEALLDRCPMPPGAIARARRMFLELAEAEARVHGIPIERVHYHEVGATDSLVDFALAGLVLDRLGCRVEASPALVGRGRVRMAHGHWPVPPPGTAELLRAGGIPVRALPPDFPWEDAELTTPTGACLLRRAERFGDLPPGRVVTIGVGAGTLQIPGFLNVVRLVLLDAGETPRPAAPVQVVEAPPAPSRFDTDRVAVLETWIDDMPGNLLAAAVEELVAEGALDVALSPLTLKKGRPGHRLEVLVPEARAEDVAAAILGRTTTIGLRVSIVTRWKLWRAEALTRSGLPGKEVRDAGGEIRRTAPETEALLARSRADGRAPMFGWQIEDRSGAVPRAGRPEDLSGADGAVPRAARPEDRDREGESGS